MKSPSLKAKLMFLLLGIIIVSNGILGFLAYSMAKPALGKSVEQTITGVSADIANQLGKAGEREFHLLDALANLSMIRDPDVSLADKNAVISGVAKTDPNYENIAFYDAQGNSIASTGQLVNMAEREYFTRAMAGEKCVVDPLFSPVTKSLLMFYSVPVRDPSGRIIGALVAIFHGDALSKLCAGITIGEASHPFVINMKTGKTIADADMSFVEKGQVLKDSATGEMREAILDAMAGNTAYRTFFESWRQKNMVAAYRPVPDNSNWAVFCMAPYDDFFGAIGRMALSMSIVVVAVLVIAVVVSTLVISMNLRPLKAVESSVTEIASGNADLTKRIALSSNDEIGNVVSGFNKFTEKFQGIISSLKNSNSNLGAVGADMSASVSDTAGSIEEMLENIESMRRQIDGQSRSVSQTAGAVNEIAANIESLEQMIEGQSSGVTEASAAVEQMIGNISSVNHSVDKMAFSFNALRSDSQTGISKQKSVNDRITQIESQSKMLQEANVAISTIASQTNLLAMNAAIEAAHAGDAGKGFAVVADEIRKLSETSTVQSKTIGVQLKNIRNSISEVVSASNESSVAFESVSRKLEETDALVMQIKAAMEEQNAGSKQIIDALHSMNDSTVEVRNASQEMADGSRVILGEVEQLKNATTAMTQGMEGMSVGARKISETGSALNGIAGKMNESIAEIGAQIDQFKV